MIPIRLQTRGLESTVAKFRSLPSAMREKILRPALMEGGRRILATAKRLVRVRTGRLRSRLKILVRTRQGLPRILISTGDPAGHLFKGRQFYGAFIEFGHYQGRRGLPNRKWIRAYPYLRPAARSNRRIVKAIIMRHIQRILGRRGDWDD